MRNSGAGFFHPRFWSATAAVWTAAVLALALSPNAKSSWLMKTLGDKVLHGFAFFVGCFLWAKVFQSNSKLSGVGSALAGAAVSLGIGLAVEFLQAYIPARTADPRDFLADVIGVLPAVASLMLAAVARKPRAA